MFGILQIFEVQKLIFINKVVNSSVWRGMVYD